LRPAAAVAVVVVVVGDAVEVVAGAGEFFTRLPSYKSAHAQSPPTIHSKCVECRTLKSRGPIHKTSYDKLRKNLG